MTFLTNEGSTSATRVERKNSLQLRSAARWISRNLPFPSNPPHRKRKKKKEKNHNTYVRIFLRGRLERKERKEEREGATVSIQYDELKAYAYSTPEAEIEMQKRRLNFTADGARSRHRGRSKNTIHTVKRKRWTTWMPLPSRSPARRTNIFVFRRRFVWLVIPTRQRRRAASSSNVVGRQTCQPSARLNMLVVTDPSIDSNARTCAFVAPSRQSPFNFFNSFYPFFFLSLSFSFSSYSFFFFLSFSRAVRRGE